MKPSRIALYTAEAALAVGLVYGAHHDFEGQPVYDISETVQAAEHHIGLGGIDVTVERTRDERLGRLSLLKLARDGELPASAPKVDKTELDAKIKLAEAGVSDTNLGHGALMVGEASVAFGVMAFSTEPSVGLYRKWMRKRRQKRLQERIDTALAQQIVRESNLSSSLRPPPGRRY